MLYIMEIGANCKQYGMSGKRRAIGRDGAACCGPRPAVYRASFTVYHCRSKSKMRVTISATQR